MSDTIARLAAAAARDAGASQSTSGLQALGDFGTNPGALKAFVHMPDHLAPGAPLVVVLHGCTQSAGGYDRASGWSQLADEQGFALLYPEQQRGNNANGCFNWFEPDDTRRDSGEALSIRQMIATVQERHAIDPRRIFVTGLSAGGAMTAAMLATYPDVFAAGAIIAGLPHGITSGVVQAFDRMRGHRLPGEAELQAALHDASDHAAVWPRLSIWHGDADQTVSVGNAEAILAQWRGVHGLADAPTTVDQVDGIPHRVWRDRDGRIAVEEYIIPGMGHGTPLNTRGNGAYGSPAPYMLDVGISSTLRIAEFWGIAGAQAPRAARSRTKTEPATLPAQPEARRLRGQRIDPTSTPSPSGVGRIIEDALRAAGLMK
ncbi:MAG TPA: PHB depolymerase family esterase [Sphingomonas sp.]